MKKPILYGTPICPDCEPMKEYLDSKRFEYDYVDITSDIILLKEFISMRDKRAEFDFMKENGYVGVPALLLNDKIYYDEQIKEIVK